MTKSESIGESFGALADEEPEISLIDLATVLGEEKWMVVLVMTVVALIALTISLVLPVVYTGKTTLLPPQQSQSAASAVLASLGGLAAATGVGIKSPDELYVGLMKSDTVLNALIEHFNLKERYKAKSMQETRVILARNTVITPDKKSGLVTVEVDDQDPATAALLANSYPEELRKLLTRVAVTDAQQRRMFYEQQIIRAKGELAAAELLVKQTQDKSGLLSIDAQTQSAISSAAQIRGQLVAREVQLQAMRPYTGPDNPDLKRLFSEITSLKAQLLKMEGGTVEPSSEAKFSAGPKDALANVRAYRELKYQESVYAAMLQQLQFSKVDEAKEAPLVQQVDVAFPPENKSRPKRAQIVLGGTLIGLVLGIFWSFSRLAIAIAKSHPRWVSFRGAWALKKTSAGQG